MMQTVLQEKEGARTVLELNHLEKKLRYDGPNLRWESAAKSLFRSKWKEAD